MENLLEKIALNTEPKSFLQIVVSEAKSRFKTKFNPPIQLNPNKRYEMALVNLETYYSFPNIDSSNNLFRYSADYGQNWINLRIPEGSYEITDINEYIQVFVKHIGQIHGYAADQDNVSLLANVNTLKLLLVLKDNFQVDFRPADSIRSVLGFNSQAYTSGNWQPENLVNILNINSILVSVDIIAASDLNRFTQPIIYSFFPNVSPGHKILSNFRNLVYLPITLDTIHSMETMVTDQNGKDLNLREETISMRFHLREM